MIKIKRHDKKDIFGKLISLLENYAFSIAISWKASRLFFLLRVFFETATAVIPILTSYLLSVIIDIISAKFFNNRNESISLYIKVFLIYFLAQISSAAIGKIRDIFGTIHQDMINNAIDLQIIRKINTLDISYFDNPDFYDEMLRANNDSQALQTLTWVAVNLISGLIQTVSCAVILTRVSWAIPVFLILLNIPSMVVERKYIKINYDWQRSRASQQRKMNYFKDLLKTKTYAKDVRIFNLQDYFCGGFIKTWKTWFGEKKRIAYKRSLYSSLANALPQVGTTSVLVYIGIKIINRVFTIGKFTFFSSMTSQFTSGIGGIFGSITSVYENELKLEHYKKFLKWEPRLSENGTLNPAAPVNIEFRNVSFRYPGTDRYILKNVCFRIQAYEKVALVGVNGAGKSTVIKLILRLYDPTEGEIYLNGINAKEYDAKQYHRLFGVVFQDFSNYAFTLKESIELSDIEHKNDVRKLIRSCEAAGIGNIIKRFPDGLNSYLTKQFSDHGEELSGGEWQKIAIARAYFRDSRFMIMDEPTSALDPEAEYSMYQTLADLSKEKGALFISHRLSSVTMADRILLLENGVISESGTHRELLKKDGRYAYLFRLQAERYVS